MAIKRQNQPKARAVGAPVPFGRRPPFLSCFECEFLLFFLPIFKMASTSWFLCGRHFAMLQLHNRDWTKRALLKRAGEHATIGRVARPPLRRLLSLLVASSATVVVSLLALRIVSSAWLFAFFMIVPTEL